MGDRALTICTEVATAELRRLTRREKDRAASARMQAIAGALEGLPWAEVRLAGMDRQALRDAVMRYNAEGLAGLRDRPRSGRPARLDERQKMGKLMHQLALSWQKAQPSHPKADAAARKAFAKGGCKPPSTTRGRRITTNA